MFTAAIRRGKNLEHEPTITFTTRFVFPNVADDNVELLLASNNVSRHVKPFTQSTPKIISTMQTVINIFHKLTMAEIFVRLLLS